ncbi:hypothetical protein PHPALM_30773 [Phytophthora palmivora]|uniref:Uncharacterized protein n=1 Tax=Phytophthora palmivora TaxID=4796 RepID=A0A2P4X4B7_9STRA|nr:hypothetical protein PHPALM_30773 [Phytophthora palmivora]
MPRANNFTSNSISDEDVAKQELKEAKGSEKRAMKLKKHRANMVVYRLEKKKMQNSLQTECNQLERVMKKYLKVMQKEMSYNNAYGSSIYEVLRDLIVEKEALQTQNTALYRDIKMHEKFCTVFLRSSQEEKSVLPVRDDDKDLLDPEFTASLPVTSKVEWKVQNGKRKLGCSMMIIDSEANKLSRDAEMHDNDVEWITKGWAYVTLTEVDDAPINSKLVEDWATLTTEAWTNEVKLEWKKKQRCETLARFRSSKKKKFANMCSERDHLEHEVKRRLVALNAIANAERNDAQNASKTSAICRLGLESDALRNENLEIHHKLQHLKRCWSLIQEGFAVLRDDSDLCSSTLNLYEASEKSQWVSNPRVNEPGWRVRFPNGEPSFYFHPFTRQEFDSMHEHLLDEFHVKLQQIESVECSVGSLFGWTIHHAPLTRRLEDNAIMTHARFGMRAYASMEEVDELVLKSELKWLPLLVTPPNWNDKQREAVSIQVLQEFEMDAYIMIA